MTEKGEKSIKDFKVKMDLMYVAHAIFWVKQSFEACRKTVGALNSSHQNEGAAVTGDSEGF